MYEHLRNDLLLDLENRFSSSELDQIMAALDKVAANYTITERETSLAVIDDETPKLVRLYLSSKKLEGASDNTIELYANRLRLFFDNVRRIPQDISILGFDDIPLCRYTIPPLTTIRQDREDLGKSAFFALSNLLNKVPLGTFLLHAALIRRASCAAVTAEPVQVP